MALVGRGSIKYDKNKVVWLVECEENKRTIFSPDFIISKNVKGKLIVIDNAGAPEDCRCPDPKPVMVQLQLSPNAAENIEKVEMNLSMQNYYPDNTQTYQFLDSSFPMMVWYFNAFVDVPFKYKHRGENLTAGVQIECEFFYKTS